MSAALDGAAERDFRVIIGRCFDVSIGRPLSLWRDLLEDYQRRTPDGPQPPRLLDRELTTSPSEDRDELFEALSSFIFELADDQQVVLVLEDVHWADSLSVDLLRALARMLGVHPLLIITTSRDRPQSDAPFARLLPAIVREGPTRRIELRPLAVSVIADLVRDRYGLTAVDVERLSQFLAARTDGNPLLVQEMLHTLELDGLIEPRSDGWRLGDLKRARVPRLIQQMVQNRMDRFSESTRRLVEFASVIGEVAPLDLWEAASDSSLSELEKAVQEASAANVLIESAGEPAMRFRHVLIRDAIYEAVTLPRRRLWHTAIANQLAKHHAPDPDAVADHLQLAGRGDAAVPWLVRAAERALTLHAVEAAVGRASAAIDLAAEWNVDLPLEVYRTRARGLEIQGSLDAARSDYERAFAKAEAAGDARLACQAALDLGEAWSERDYRRAAEWYDRALALTDGLDDQIKARTLNRIGNWHTNREEPERALRMHQEALAIFEAAADRGGLAGTLDLIAVTNYLAADLPTCAATYFRAVPIFEELGDRRGLATCLAILPITAGTFETTTVVPAPYPVGELIAAGERALQIARSISWRAGEGVTLIHLALRLAALGEYRRAWEFATAGHEMAESIGHRQWRISGAVTIAAQLIDLFSPEDARKWLERSLVLARDVQSLYWERITLGLLAAAAIDLDELDEARRLLGQLEDAVSKANTLASRYAAYQLARLDLVEGQPADALRGIERLIASNRGASGAETPHLALLRAQALDALGRRDEAREELNAAHRVSEGRHELPILWRLAAMQARLASDGRGDEFHAHLSTARKIVQTIGDQIDDEGMRGRFLERALGELPDVVESEPDPFGLSPREIEVLRLIAQGYRDREIADELFISPRTVTNHVANILQKMDVPSRAAAAVEGVRRGII